MKEVFLDANVLIGLVSTERDNHDMIREFFLSCDIKKLYISPLSIHIAFYVLKIKSNEKKHRDLKILLENINIIPLTKRIVERSVNIAFPDFEGCLQYFSAIDNCDYILTADKKDFDKIKKLSPSNISIVSDFRDIG
jgi:predicted nucleic acid-binding protein